MTGGIGPTWQRRLNVDMDQLLSPRLLPSLFANLPQLIPRGPKVAAQHSSVRMDWSAQEISYTNCISLHLGGEFLLEFSSVGWTSIYSIELYVFHGDLYRAGLRMTVDAWLLTRLFGARSLSATASD